MQPETQYTKSGCEPGCTPASSSYGGTLARVVAGSGIEFAERGTHELKGVPGEWRLYAVSDA